MKNAYGSFQNLIGQLQDIKSQIDDAKDEKQYELLSLQNEQDDMKLVQLFEKQSAKMRKAMNEKHKTAQQRRHSR